MILPTEVPSKGVFDSFVVQKRAEGYVTCKGGLQAKGEEYYAEVLRPWIMRELSHLKAFRDSTLLMFNLQHIITDTEPHMSINLLMKTTDYLNSGEPFYRLFTSTMQNINGLSQIPHNLIGLELKSFKTTTGIMGD